MMNPYLLYCLEHQDTFPNDFDSARNFWNFGFIETALRHACTCYEFEAIRKCEMAAVFVLASHGVKLVEIESNDIYATYLKRWRVV
jgi:hypothetical protein